MEKSKRNSNIELLRVISMIMIIALHYFNQGGLLEHLKPTNKNYYIVWLIESLCYVSVNCYVLISGYFLSASHPKSRGIIKTITEVVFYSVGIYILFCIFGLESFNIKSLITGYLFPITHGEYWFATVYVVLFLISPFVNIFIANVEKSDYKRLLIILTVVLSVIPTVVFFYGDTIGNNGGYSLIWFIYLYLLAGYIRKYNMHFDNIKCLLLYLSFSVVPFIFKILQQKILHTEYWNLYRYTSVPILIASVALFMFFIQLPENHNRLWIWLGSTTFAVFLIHTQYLMRDKFLWKVVVKPLNYCYGNIGVFLLHFVVSVLGIFIICSIIDFLRQFLFNNLLKFIFKFKRNNKI